MQNGIKTLPDGDYCLKCNAKLLAAYDFCPKCGEALSLNAKIYKGQQNKRVKLELLEALANEISDANSLQVIMKKIKEI